MSYTSYEASVHHTTEENGEEVTGFVTLSFDGVSVSGGCSARMNPPGKAHPAEPPEVTFDECEIEDDEHNRDLDPISVFEHHDSEFCEQLVRAYGEAHDPANRNPPGV